jgi:4'-phosphopantetheinyl transferase
VHVWRASLDQVAQVIERHSLSLSPDERERAERFHFLRDKIRFIASRGILRTLLGRYIEVEPGRLRFCYSSYGKPALDEEFAGQGVHFNISHSNGLGLFALARGRELGIDLEWIRPDLAEQEIAERFFSCEEVRALRALPESERQEAFFRCWTRKEAYIKAKGEGLSMPLDSFDVSLVAGEPPMLLRTRSDAREALRWSLIELCPAPGFVAAAAVERGDWNLKCFDWPD